MSLINTYITSSSSFAMEYSVYLKYANDAVNFFSNDFSQSELLIDVPLQYHTDMLKSLRENNGHLNFASGRDATWLNDIDRDNKIIAVRKLCCQEPPK